MNTIDFTQTGGFPLDQNVLALMQAQSQLAAKSALLGGTMYVLSGGVQTGSNVTPGVVVINGEVLPFDGGVAQTKVIIIETGSNLTYEDGVARPVQKVRKAAFGDDGVTNYLWSAFKKPLSPVLDRLERIEKMLKPLIGYTVGSDTVYGSWLFWGRPASEIPDGWEAVPDADWKGRVPVVMDVDQIEFATIGQTGGEKTNTLTRAQLPHVKINNGLNSAGGAYLDQDPFDNIGTGSGGAAIQTDYLGDGDAHNNLQPYKVVLFIRFIA